MFEPKKPLTCGEWLAGLIIAGTILFSVLVLIAQHAGGK